jgi:hypothetical protein
MAVVRREYNMAAYWNSDTLLDVLETALADVGFHAPTQTGSILTFTNTAGTTIAGQRGRRYLVKQSATNGSGLYATFDVLRNQTTGAISAVTLVRGGKNYAASNTLTIPGASIGGVTPTDNITITVSTVSGNQGSTTTFFDKDTANPYTWAVCCVNNNEEKMLGQTFYSFHVPANPTFNPSLFIRAGSGFQSTTNVFLGVSTLDWFSTNIPNTTAQQHFSQVIARSNSTPLRLVTYQSGIDPNFVVFQFSDIEKYGDVFRDPFILSRYNSATQPWDLDDCFTGGIYSLGKINQTSTADCQVFSTIALAPLGKRQAEFGYAPTIQGTYANYRGLFGVYESAYGKRVSGIASQFTAQIYNRTLHDGNHDTLEYNPIINNIPICNVMIPVPYYMPADFGVTEVNGTNTIAHRDLLQVGPTTRWRVIQYANNQEAVAIVFTAQVAAKAPNLTPYMTSIAFVCKVID